MGLSNDERREVMFKAINELTKIKNDPHGLASHVFYGSDTCRGIQRLQEQLGDLWHGLLRGIRAGRYWPVGNELGHDVTESHGPWSTAIVALCGRHRVDPRIKVRRKRLNPEPDNPFGGTLSTRELIRAGKNGNALQAVYDVYENIERLAYGLRRYDDSLRRGLPVLDRLVSDIAGTCFSIFRLNEIFARAYVLRKIALWIYTGKRSAYDYNEYAPDPTGAALITTSMGGSLLGAMRPQCSLAEAIAWDKWRLTHKSTPQNRVVLAMRVSGARLCRLNTLDSLIGATRGLKPRPRKKVIRKEYRKCQKLLAKAEESWDGYPRDRMAEHTVVHGWQPRGWLKEE